MLLTKFCFLLKGCADVESLVNEIWSKSVTLIEKKSGRVFMHLCYLNEED